MGVIKLTKVGEIAQYVSDAQPEGIVEANRQALLRTGKYSRLWAWVQANPEVYDTTGVNEAKYGPGDGSTTFDLPDWRGAFLRGAGTHSSWTKANGGAVSGGITLTKIDDKFQGFLYGGYTTTGGNTGFSSANGQGGSNVGVEGGFFPDSTNGTPRTGDETAPLHVPVRFGIYYS